MKESTSALHAGATILLAALLAPSLFIALWFLTFVVKSTPHTFAYGQLVLEGMLIGTFCSVACRRLQFHLQLAEEGASASAWRSTRFYASVFSAIAVDVLVTGVPTAHGTGYSEALHATGAAAATIACCTVFSLGGLWRVGCQLKHWKSYSGVLIFNFALVSQIYYSIAFGRLFTRQPTWYAQALLCFSYPPTVGLFKLIALAVITHTTPGEKIRDCESLHLVLELQSLVLAALPFRFILLGANGWLSACLVTAVEGTYKFVAYATRLEERLAERLLSPVTGAFANVVSKAKGSSATTAVESNAPKPHRSAFASRAVSTFFFFDRSSRHPKRASNSNHGDTAAEESSGYLRSDELLSSAEARAAAAAPVQTVTVSAVSDVTSGGKVRQNDVEEGSGGSGRGVTSVTSVLGFARAEFDVAKAAKGPEESDDQPAKQEASDGRLDAETMLMVSQQFFVQQLHDLINPIWATAIMLVIQTDGLARFFADFGEQSWSVILRVVQYEAVAFGAEMFITLAAYVTLSNSLKDGFRPFTVGPRMYLGNRTPVMLAQTAAALSLLINLQTPTF